MFATPSLRSRPAGRRTLAGLFLLAASTAAHPQSQLVDTRALAPSGSTSVPSTAGAPLWDQPPTDPQTFFAIDQEFPDNFDATTFLVHDVAFTSRVHLSSISAWFTNNNGGWPGNITSARLSIFSAPLDAADAPADGVVVPASLVADGTLLRLDASVDIELPSGSYWIGLTPIGELSVVGQEFHVIAQTVVGAESSFRNPGGGFGNGSDWTDDFGLPNYTDGSLRIEGTVLPDCGFGSSMRIDQVPNLANAQR